MKQLQVTSQYQNRSGRRNKKKCAILTCWPHGRPLPSECSPVSKADRALASMRTLAPNKRYTGFAWKIAWLFSNKPSQCGWSLTHLWKSTNSLSFQNCYNKFYKWCSAEYSCVFSMCSKRCLTYCMFVDVLRWQAIYSESGQNVYSHVMLSNLYTFAV